MDCEPEKVQFCKIAKLDNLIELTEQNGEIGFLVKVNDDLKFMVEIAGPGIIFVSPHKHQIPFTLPRCKETIRYYNQDSDKNLFRDLIQYHKEVSELPNDKHYPFLAAWVMHTYLLEKVKYSPIICFDGVYEMGKTRTGTGMTDIAYRGFLVESVREAHIFRLTDCFGGAMFFDVMDFWAKVTRSNSEDIFLKRYEKGARVMRVKDFTKKAFDDVEYYDIFGPTIIATNESMSSILESRGVTINMRKSDREFSEVPDEVRLSLKERLTAFRARHYKQALPNIAKPAKGRLGDILKPLFQITHLACPEFIPSLTELVTEIKLRKGHERSQSREAYLLKAAWESKGKVVNSLLPIKEIVENLKQKMTPKSVATKFRKMGFKTDRTAGNSSALVWDKEYLKKQMCNYSVEISPEYPE